MIVIVGKKRPFQMRIDSAFFFLIIPIRWTLNIDNGYAETTLHKKTTPFHRYIYELMRGPIPIGMTVDHINGDRLDNRLVNLRLATRRQQAQNHACHRNGHIVGTTFDKIAKRWSAKVTINGRRTHVGNYNSQEEAGLAYQEAVRKYSK